jgi:hypothetical protein
MVVVRGLGQRSWAEARQVLAAVASAVAGRAIEWRSTEPEVWVDGDVRLEIRRGFDPFCFPKDPSGIIFTVDLRLGSRILLNVWAANGEHPHEPFRLPLDVTEAERAAVLAAVTPVLSALEREPPGTRLALSAAPSVARAEGEREAQHPE